MAKMQANKIHEHLEDHGDHLRIERRARAELDTSRKVKDPMTGREVHPVLLDADGNGVYHWVVYEKVDTGAEVERDDSGNVTKVLKPGKHPVIMDKAGEPIDTTYHFVWVPVFAGTEEQARAKLNELAR